MDTLSDVLRVFALEGGVFLDAKFSAPWAVVSRVEPQDLRLSLPKSAHLLAYHYIAEGQPLLRIGDSEPMRLHAGEVILLPRNATHVLSSAEGLQPIDAGPLVTSPEPGALARIRWEGGGEATRLVCGYIGCEAGRHPLINALPEVLRLDIREWDAGPWVESLFRYAAQESASRRPGGETTLAKVSELLFVEAVRQHLDRANDEHRGWIAGLMDPAVGRALALIHERPEQAWTVEGLAREVFLSRSAFAERFTTLVGMAPLGYLTSWRMQRAKHALRQGRPIAHIVGEVGYESEAAFSRAFKREVGCAPSQWRA